MTQTGGEGRTPIAEDNARHIRSIYRKLVELNEKVSRNSKDLREFTERDVPHCSEDTATEGIVQEAVDKVDDVLEALGEPFDTLSNKIDQMRYDQIFKFSLLHDRFNSIEEKLEEALERPHTVHYNGPVVHTAPQSY